MLQKGRGLVGTLLRRARIPEEADVAHDPVQIGLLGANRETPHPGRHHDLFQERAIWFALRNTLIVAQGHDHPLLLSDTLAATPLSWVLGTAPAAAFRCLARCRHRQPLQACAVTLSDAGGAARVQFDQPQRAVTPGQFVAFYRDGECLGGGVIERTG